MSFNVLQFFQYFNDKMTVVENFKNWRTMNLYKIFEGLGFSIEDKLLMTRPTKFQFENYSFEV